MTAAVAAAEESVASGLMRKIGWAHERMEQPAQAHVAFSRAIELDPTNHFALMNRGRLVAEHMPRRMHEAVGDFVAVARLRPDIAAARDNVRHLVGVLEGAGAEVPAEAAALLAAAAAAAPTDATPPHREARAETKHSSKPPQAKAKRKKGKKGKRKAKRNTGKSLVGAIVHKHYPGAGLHKGKVIKARRMMGGAQYYDVLWTDGTVSQLPRADVRRHTVK